MPLSPAERELAIRDNAAMAILHFTLGTRDVPGTARFFEKTFGWKRLDRPANIPLASEWFEIGFGQEMHVVEVPDFEPSRCEREYGRHIALSYPKAQLSELKDRLRAEGAELIPPARATPHERFFFRDPNGYVFEVIES